MNDEVNKIFSAAADLGNRWQRASDITKMKEQIGKLRTTCGSCQFWMCSSLCPAEWNERGTNRGPSCNARACEKFLIKDWDERQEKLLIDQVKKLESI